VQANAARDRQDWPRAADAYQAALRADPGLAHIWVQLGHARKEAGRAADAAQAYQEAARLRPGDAEPELQLGHLFNVTGDHIKAGEHYLRAFQANPGLVDAATALHRALARARGRRRAELIEILRRVAPEPAMADQPASRPGMEARTGVTLAFDVSDLILYYAHGRPPTGIQRVQIQVITHALDHGTAPIRLVCFIEGRDEWLEVPVAAMRHVIDLSLSGSDRNEATWVTALHQLHVRLALAGAFAFPRGAYLVNLGSSWQLHNYFLFVRAAQAEFGVRYVPFIHDLIPILAPQHFVKAARREVVPWVLGMLHHADHMLVNSEATKRDLLHVAGILGHALDPANIAVIRLDADTRPAGGSPVMPPPSAEPYVLFVSTVESRKGHAVAFAAWQQLIARHGAGKVPKLVCVGKRGWLSQPAYAMLADDTQLAGRVEMRAGVSDTELAALYAHCMFTLYPSVYEGWGLPITEALCHGKPVIASDTSSLPEAGGDFAVYVPPGDAGALAGAAGRMAFDAAYRDAVTARIRRDFRPRRWSDLAQQAETELQRMAARDPGPVQPPRAVARLGAYHSLARSTALRIWPGAGNAEMFRTGTGWGDPHADGSWTRPEGGHLTIGLPPGAGRGPGPSRPLLRLGLLLLGSPYNAVDWRVQVRHGPGLAGSLKRHGRKWVTLGDIQPGAGPLEIRLLTEPGETELEPEHEETVGLAGFFLYEQDDAAARLRLMEAIALDNLDEIDAYRDATPPPPLDWN
jgi:glycosyltransferase involved in cell wall biosynthesis